jgi:hypothetical protein
LANKGGFHENPLSDGEGISTRNIPTSWPISLKFVVSQLQVMTMSNFEFRENRYSEDHTLAVISHIYFAHLVKFVITDVTKCC